MCWLAFEVCLFLVWQTIRNLGNRSWLGISALLGFVLLFTVSFLLELPSRGGDPFGSEGTA